MARLTETQFVISQFHFPGVNFPFDRFELDSNVCFRRNGEEECIACIATKEDEDMLKNEAEQTVLEIAAIYALLTPFTFRISPGISHSLGSSEELGRHRLYEAKLQVRFVESEEKLRQYSEEVSTSWQKTRGAWTKAREMLHGKKFLELALFYYYRSGLGTQAVYGGSIDEAFIDAAIGLEALYNDSPQDIAYKLATRAALLLSCSDKEDENDVFKSLKDLYKKRNNIVHGIEREEVEWKDHELIRKFLRSSLRSCLALAVERDKMRIIDLIDRAIARPGARRELTEAIQKGITYLGL